MPGMLTGWTIQRWVPAIAAKAKSRTVCVRMVPLPPSRSYRAELTQGGPGLPPGNSPGRHSSGYAGDFVAVSDTHERRG